MNRMEFDKAVEKEFVETSHQIEITAGGIMICQGRVKLVIDVDAEIRKLDEITVPELCNLYKVAIYHRQTESAFQVDYGSVFPIVVREDFEVPGQDLEFALTLIPGMKIGFVQSIDGKYRYISENDNYEMQRLMESAFMNLKRIIGKVQKIDERVSIYSFPMSFQFAGAAFFEEETKTEIQKELGTRYLFSITSARTILYAAENETNLKIMRTLVKVESNKSDFLSTSIYLYNEGIISVVQSEEN